MVRDSVVATLPEPYHKGRPSRPSQIPAGERFFIAWDGEGMNLRGAHRPQSYVLFGASTGEYIKGESLNTFELCDFIIEVGRKYPNGSHVGFAFTYDANMIVKSLHPRNLEWLHKHGYVNLTSSKTGHRYCIIMRKGKWFSVTRYNNGYDKSRNSNAKHTVRIEDIFGFFTCSFVEKEDGTPGAVEKLLGYDAPGLALVRKGKDKRRDFTYAEFDYVKTYWDAEIKLLAMLAEELKKRLHAGGLTIRQWYGPGALASFCLKREGIQKHMSRGPDPVREAARFAYIAGRFEHFSLGRVNKPVYGFDRNSAYPYAITKLPSLSEGKWVHVKSPQRIARFGVYRVRLNVRSGFNHAPSPLFHRDKRHNISFPWITEGWYWSPEVANIFGNTGVEVVEGWELLETATRPFRFVYDQYLERRARKEANDSTELGYKLAMNSYYGKFAQRVGWDEKTRRIPPWHQLEWAGWITSHCRAAMYRLMLRIPHGKLISVETDGVYTTATPAEIGITAGTGLGEWDVSRYDEVMYVQSGLAWLRKGDQWETKRRGLDPGSFTRAHCEDYLQTLQPNERWAPFEGVTTRFIGLGAALASKAPLKVRHCLWETRTREVVPGEHGKRIHVNSTYCRACQDDKNAYEQAHDLVIRSRAQVGEMSTPHFIPWEGKDDGASEPDWRDYEQELGDVT